MADPATLSVPELEAEVTAMAAHLHAGTCRWLELVAELDGRGGWAAEGRDSRAAWIAWRCGLEPRTAREYVRVARRLPELPRMHAAFAAGEFSYAKVRALTRIATPENDSLWKQAGGSAEPRPARQASNAEALVAVADAALAHQGDGRGGGERYQVIVHVDEPVLAQDGDGGCELEDGSALAPETARRLACDASLVRDGRRSRAIPPAIQRALRRRDRGCRFPGCENRRFVDAHHVQRWARGGETRLGNLVLLCRRHHRAVHEGGYTVDAEGRFFYPWGGEIAPVPRLPRGDPAEIVGRNHDLGIHERTCAGGFQALPGEFTVAASVDYLFEIERRAATRARAPT